jgi:hypothetical protein
MLFMFCEDKKIAAAAGENAQASLAKACCSCPPLTADGVPLRYQQPATPEMGGDRQHFDQRPLGPRPMEAMFAAVRLTRRPQAPVLFDMASLPVASAAPVAQAMPGMPLA